MTAVAHEANRPWDGRRLLRFLTGLAMLALAVMLHLPAQAAPAPVAVQPAAAAAVTTAAASETNVTEEEQVTPVEEVAPAAGFPAPVLRSGAAPTTGDSRAPPTR